MPNPVCLTCDQIHERIPANGTVAKPTCRGHRSRENAGDPLRPCMRFPLRGATVCPKHGGNAPQVREAAARRVQAAKVERTMRLNLEMVDERYLQVHPIIGLLEEVARSHMAVEWLAWQVEKLHAIDPDDTAELRDVIGIDGEGRPIYAQPQGKLYGPARDGTLGVHPLWAKLDQERERHAKFCKMALDAGVSERQIQMQESTAHGVVEVILHVIDGLALSPDLATRARTLAAEKLRSMRPEAIDAEATETDPDGDAGTG